LNLKCRIDKAPLETTESYQITQYLVF